MNALVGGVTLGGTFLWLAYASSALVLPAPGTSVSAQLAFIAAHPAAYARALYWTLLEMGSDYYEQLIGVLGWLNVRLPPIAYVVPLAGLLLCIPTSESPAAKLPLHAVAWLALLVLASALLVMTALYLYLAPIGNAKILGVQGRYFLPLLAPAAVALGAVLEVRTSMRFARSTLLALAVNCAHRFGTTLTSSRPTSTFPA